MATARDIRYQGAIMRDGRVLLIRHRHYSDGRSYWLFPGGGIEPGESELECVCREMREETGLEVKVERLVFDKPYEIQGMYRRRHMYLCSIVAGEPAPGFEPEPEAAAEYQIIAVRWFDLADESDWGDAAHDRFTGPELRLLRAALDGSPLGSGDR